MSACVLFPFPFILDVNFVPRTIRSQTGGTSHRIYHPPSCCGAWLHLSRGKDSAIPSPPPPSWRILRYSISTSSLLFFSYYFPAPLFLRQHRNQQILQQVQNFVRHDYIKSCTVYTVTDSCHNQVTRVSYSTHSTPSHHSTPSEPLFPGGGCCEFLTRLILESVNHTIDMPYIYTLFSSTISHPHANSVLLRGHHWAH